MAYLLDTNAVVAVLKDADSPVGQRLRREAPGDVFISSIVLHELFYGAFKSARVERNLAVVERLRFGVLDFSAEDARAAGMLRAALAAKGTPIGPYDVLIAGQALARGLVLVTRNSGEFERVFGLRVESWI
ncbi:type II toxin-antitoxin system VapC family toxin [Rubritepida flocculans]|uniref:type II toxin-antitoxin system VapC family toxin n=1 Tax=Rubritepida flocculans TaxID=182403 RepID=UPI00040E7B7B|nr:type II toxin-antitoxin system VapC family toxin [Rubritepida flocculans]